MRTHTPTLVLALALGACGAPLSQGASDPLASEGPTGVVASGEHPDGVRAGDRPPFCGFERVGEEAPRTSAFVPCAGAPSAIDAFARALRTGDDTLLWRLLPVAERIAWRPEDLGLRVRAPEVNSRWRGLAELLTSTPTEISVGGPAGSRVMARFGDVTLTLVDEGAEEGWKIVNVAPTARFLPEVEGGDG